MIELKKHIYDESNGLWYQMLSELMLFQNSFKLGTRLMVKVMNEQLHIESRLLVGESAGGCLSYAK